MNSTKRKWLSNASPLRSSVRTCGDGIALDVDDKQGDGTIFIIPLRLEECDVSERLSRRQWVCYLIRTASQSAENSSISHRDRIDRSERPCNHLHWTLASYEL